MDDLIAALTIFRKYSDTKHPTHCEHDELRVEVDPDVVSDEDKRALEALSFTPTRENNFRSYRFGSC